MLMTTHVRSPILASNQMTLLGPIPVISDCPHQAEVIVDSMHQCSGAIINNREDFRHEFERIGVGVTRFGVPKKGDCDWIKALTEGITAELIVVCPVSIDAVTSLWAIRKEDFSMIWEEVLPWKLRTVLGRVSLDANPLGRFRSGITRVLASSPLVARAITKICAEGGPPKSVSELANNLKVAPSTLRYHWYSCFGRGFHPKELIDWAMLLTALLPRCSGGRHKQAVLASHVPVHLRTLQRQSRRLTGKSLRELQASPGTAVRGFQEYVKAAFRNTIMPL